jgi:hypothetical protein
MFVCSLFIVGWYGKLVGRCPVGVLEAIGLLFDNRELLIDDILFDKVFVSWSHALLSVSARNLII